MSSYKICRPIPVSKWQNIAFEFDKFHFGYFLGPTLQLDFCLSMYKSFHFFMS